MGFESVSASEDVIGNFLRPGLSSIYEIGGNPGRRGKEKVGALAGSRCRVHILCKHLPEVHGPLFSNVHVPLCICYVLR